MRLLKTIHKGCNEGIAEPHCSHIVRFSLSTCASHATLMSMLGSAFLFAQQNADDNLTDKPFNICVLWPVDEHTKRKSENAESMYDALIYFLQSMSAPKNGVVISIYHIDTLGHMNEQWLHGNFWHFEKQWSPQDEYITVHKHEPLMSRHRISGTVQYENLYMPIIEDLANSYGWDIKEIDYTMTMKDIVETMTHSNYHFAYLGGTWFLSAMIGIPSLCWHHNHRVFTNKRKWVDIDEKIHEVDVQNNSWGVTCTGNAWIKQYSFEHERVLSHPNYNQLWIEDKADIYKAFEDMEKRLSYQ